MSVLKWCIAVCIIAVSFLLFQACALKPAVWQPALKPSFEDKTALNEKLSQILKIDLQGWYRPEDIVFDKKGNLYCGVHVGDNDFSDGKILKISQEGNLEVFYDAGSWVAGLHFDSVGNLLALSHKQGLISISAAKKVTVLANQDPQGHKFCIPNGMDLDSTGNIYFTNTSHEKPYDIKYGRKLILELKPNGGLYKFNIKTNQIETLIDGTYFGNGVVLSQDESFLLMVETTKYRVLKYWLTGTKKGTTELFLDNLPGFPNGISIRKDGTFWLGFTTKRNDALDKVHPKPRLKKLLYALPNWMQPKQDRFGMVMNVSPNGNIITCLFDTTGLYIPEGGAVKENGGYLYIGGDNLPFIGKYNLNGCY